MRNLMIRIFLFKINSEARSLGIVCEQELRDQMSACPGCWQALFAAATLCVISEDKMLSEVKTCSGTPRLVDPPQHLENLQLD